MTTSSSLPEQMQTDYRQLPDWGVNVAFAGAFDWLAWQMEEGRVVEVNPAWLRIQAEATNRMAVEQWEDDE